MNQENKKHGAQPQKTNNPSNPQRPQQNPNSRPGNSSARADQRATKR